MSARKIKIIGVGCGGNNILNHISRNSESNLSLVACDMDSSVLERSMALAIVQLGTEGLGAGNIPEKARAAAEGQMAEVKSLLDEETSTLFIVSCLGGGCGTGASPVIARESTKKSITTIGVVTLPFAFEGDKKYYQALNGLEELSKEVDALFLLNNQHIIRKYKDLSMTEAFMKADELISKVIQTIVDYMGTAGKPKQPSILAKLSRIIIPKRHDKN